MYQDNSSYPENIVPKETQNPLEAHEVEITSADFNGYDWDGSPFKPTPSPQWLITAIKEGKVAIHPDSYDYAVWDVQTTEKIQTVGPGDIIRCSPEGNLSVGYWIAES